MARIGGDARGRPRFPEHHRRIAQGVGAGGSERSRRGRRPHHTAQRRIGPIRCVHIVVSGKHRPISYYRTPAGVEVDFIIEISRRGSSAPPHIVAIEVKRADKWNRIWGKSLRSLATIPDIKTDRLIVVYTGKRSYRFDAIDVMPAELFFRALYRGEIF